MSSIKLESKDKDLVMHKNSKINFFIFVLILTCILHLASCNFLYALGPGTTGATFLKISPGARAVGMGEAYVAIANDATALFWNPAGIVQIDNYEISLMHNFWLQGTYYDYFAFVQDLPGTGNEKFGLSITYLSSGDIERTKEDASGNYLTGDHGVFTLTDLALGLTYAWEIGEKHSLGATIKLIRSTIDDAIGYGLCADLGYLFRITPKLSAGFNAQNSLVSMPIRFYRQRQDVSASHTLPINTKAGLAYRCMDDKLLLGFDVNFPIDNLVNYHAGAEYAITDSMLVRVGYKTNLITDLDVLSGLSLGFGYKFLGYDFDYAFVPYGDLGVTHRISLLMKF